MNQFNKILIGAVVALLIFGGVAFKLYQNERTERKRQASNVEQLTKNMGQADMELDLKRSEFEKADTWWKRQLDSVNTVHGIALKSVKSATIINTEYKDTTKAKTEHERPVLQPDQFTYLIPVSKHDSCWGMEGYILSSDSLSTLTITERTAQNKAALEVTRKRFLGFLWWKKKTTFKAFTDCGEIEFVKIEFK